MIGSETGHDGTGANDQKFVSKSRRVVIEPSDWWLKRAYEFSRKPLPARFEIKWQVKPMFVEGYEPPRAEDPAREYVTTLAQGLTNAKHTIEIISDGSESVPIRAIPVYRPRVK